MATKARSRQKKSKPSGRHYGKFLLLALVVVSLLGVGYVVFLQGQLFSPLAPDSGPAETPSAAVEPAEEPLATPPGEAPTHPVTTAADTTAAVEQAPSPLAALPPEPQATPQAAKPAAIQPAPQAASLSPAQEAPPAATPKNKADAKAPAPSATQPKQGKKPLVAIIIDDMGYQPAIGRKMLALPLNLSFSFLPSGPQTKELATSAKAKGRDILLHLPLEATDRKADPGPGTLTVAMAKEELQKKFAEDLAAVPMAIGINNHMGSRFTEEQPAMTALLAELKQRHLFFLDSRTSTKSIACEAARKEGVPCLSRQLFLDNEQTIEMVSQQIDKLLRLAAKNGQAVAIGHPHPATLAAIQQAQQRLSEQVELVGIHRLVP